jgi:predicted transcriptional regulator
MLFDEDLEQRLENVARATGQSRQYYVNRMAQESLPRFEAEAQELQRLYASLEESRHEVEAGHSFPAHQMLAALKAQIHDGTI